MIEKSIKLPCGVYLKNRIVKSAMSENMATSNHRPNSYFNTLYARWANGGVGLLISGNIMVDHRTLGEPGNIIIDNKFTNIPELEKWASAGGQNNTCFWAQLNHPGKQSPKFLSSSPVAPSKIAFSSPMAKMFNTPRALLPNEIDEIVKSFAYAAGVCKKAGFSGVQIHGAHGYLISQFLSPRHNHRTDEWGGTIENRMKFVIEVYKAIREEVGKSFPVGIKLNSSDFQKGGFSEDDSLKVVQKLDELGIDLIEISGGTYEAAAMTGVTSSKVKETTRKREAYFIDFAKKIRDEVKCPILLTGGFRSLKGIKSSLEEGVFDLVGLARALAVDPELPRKLLSGEDFKYHIIRRTTGFKFLDKIFPLEIIWYTYQLVRLGKGKDPSPNLSSFIAIFWTIIHTGLTNFKRVRVK